ncbi:MAG: O-antigen ligase family protein [Victivallaceae bacterium]|nr:O-antigen ligase family protein [Victivallaceae bacterium]
MEFTYHGMVRYAYGFANPNHAAALLAILLPLLWYSRIRWRKNRSIVFILFSCELIVYAGLIMTYSRSGILAVMFGTVIFYFLFRYCSKLPKLPVPSKSWRFNYFKLFVIFTISGLIILAMVSGAGERSIKWLSSPDRSVTNRFAVWQGGLQMLADNPTGVGLGNSGVIYTIFYQDSENRNRYRTMVNSFLTFINEYGIFYWSALSSLSGFIIIATILLMRYRKTPYRIKLQLITLFTVSVIMFIIGNSSTCFDLSVINEISSSDKGETLNACLQILLLSLPIIFLFWASIIILCHRHLFSWRKTTIITFAMILIMNISLIATGALMNEARPYKCQTVNDENSYMKLTKRSGGDRTVVGFADETIFPIESFVMWLKQRYPEANLLITMSQINTRFIGTKKFKDFHYIVACGQENMLMSDTIMKKTILLFPAQPPDSSRSFPSKVILNHNDYYGYNILWEKMLRPDRIEYLSLE